MRAWLAPLLAGSTTSTRPAARENLARWLEFVTTTETNPRTPGPRLSLEIALAQGFKYAANRTAWHPQASQEARAYLAEEARWMLRGTSFWFTRLTLLHALCLWSLPANSDRERFSRLYGADFRELVAHWADRSDGQPDHPFVVEACKLVLWALRTGQPERFIWIDESSVVARTGSWSAHHGALRRHNLWIPQSAGWTMLHPRAQRLVADVLLLLNLAERGDRPSDRARRLQRTDCNYLPPCLAGERVPLDPIRTVGMAQTSAPGSNCRDGCRFGLCPYPPKGDQVQQTELSEAFCREQLSFTRRGLIHRSTAPWQETSSVDLRRFWQFMRERAQPS
jgi:hypothetical protein